MDTASTLARPSFTTDWFTRHIPIWDNQLRRFTGQPNLRFLEVGSFEGRSACWLLQNILLHESALLTCIDLFPYVDQKTIDHFAVLWKLQPPYPTYIDTEHTFDENIRAIGATSRVQKMKGKSQVLLRHLPLHSYDCVYIDGSHHATQTLLDMTLCWDLLRPDGILLFDDYELIFFTDARSNARTAIDAFLSVFQADIKILHMGWQVIVQKKECLEPPRVRSELLTGIDSV